MHTTSLSAAQDARNDPTPLLPPAPAPLPDALLDTLIEPIRVHRDLYVDPAIFAREMAAIFGRCWLYVGHESEVPEINDFKTLTLGRRPVILTRDKNRDLHVLFNRCAHRGTQVCREAKGRNRVFVCPYHGWSFQNDGSLLGVPHADGYGGKPTDERWDLGQAAQVDTLHGLIFARFSSDGPSLHEYLGQSIPIIGQFMNRSSIGPLTVGHGVHRMLVRANWKTVWDNSTDGYHAETSHRSITMLSRQRYDKDKSLSHFQGSPDETAMYQLAFGNGHSFLDQSPAMGSRWNRVRPMPGREAVLGALEAEADLDTLLEDLPGPGWNLNIFPNLMMIGNQLVVIEPVGVDSFEMVWFATQIDGAPASANTLRMRIAEDFPNLGEVDDVDVWERMQESFAIAEAPWIDMSRGIASDTIDPDTGVVRGLVTSDTGMRAFYAHYHRLMVAA